MPDFNFKKMTPELHRAIRVRAALENMSMTKYIYQVLSKHVPVVSERIEDEPPEEVEA